MNAALAVLIALGEVIWLDCPQVLEGLGVQVDDHVVDHFQRGQ